MSDPEGVILFAHGSRDLAWKEPFMAIEKRVASTLPHADVRAAYLEHSEPNLFAVVEKMVSDGITSVTIIPLFLAIGAHSRKDFPEIENKLHAAHPAINFTWDEVLGEWEETQAAIATLIADRLF